MMDNLFWIGFVGAAIAIAFAWLQSRRVMTFSEGSDKMAKIAASIREGANAYLKHQYTTVAKVFLVVFLVLLVMAFATGGEMLSQFTPFAFLTGGIWSMLAGFVGMKIATSSNARTAQAASESLNKGLRVAFSSGSVMGFTVVGLGMLDISIWFVILRFVAGIDDPLTLGNIMVMNGMGASFMALFARVGGGIYTKAALPALEAMLAQNHLKMAESFAATGGHVLELQYTVFPDRMMANINTWQDYYTIFQPPVFAISGLHNTGKTTLCEKLIQHFSGMGYRVAGIKHDGHSFEPDVPGTDSWRLRKAGANPVMVYNREILAYNEKNVYRADQLIEVALQNANLVLLEGFKDSRWPKAEILMEGEPSVSREPMALISDWGWEGGLPHYTRNDVEGIARMIQETLHLVPPSGEHDEFGKDKRGNDGN